MFGGCRELYTEFEGEHMEVRGASIIPETKVLRGPQN
jgi:hypothetical protein